MKSPRNQRQPKWLEVIKTIRPRVWVASALLGINAALIVATLHVIG